MNPDVKQKWIDALNSGEYKKGKGVLHSNDKFCAFGVLCDLAVKDGAPVEVEEILGVFAYDGSSCFLPKSVRGWAGMAYAPAKIISLNDSNASFKTIAGWIGENL